MRQPCGFTPNRVGELRRRLAVSRDVLCSIFGVASMTVQRWELRPEHHKPQGLQLVVLELLEAALQRRPADARAAVVAARDNLTPALLAIIEAAQAAPARGAA